VYSFEKPMGNAPAMLASTSCKATATPAARIGLAKALGQCSFKDVKRRINNQDSDNCGNTLAEERKRTGLR
jgi:hypothetical protein